MGQQPGGALPKALVEKMGLAEGDEVDIAMVDAATVAIAKRDAEADFVAKLRDFEANACGLSLEPRRGERAVRPFFDTNILIYASLSDDPRRLVAERILPPAAPSASRSSTNSPTSRAAS